MNNRQKAFCEHFAACGNAAEAARRAGYSDRTARSIGQRLLTDVDILTYVRALQDQAAAVRIVSMQQVKAFWSRVMDDAAETTANRLRASELLAKSAGAFVQVAAIDDGLGGFAAAPSGGDVLIVLPDNGRDPHLTKEAAKGEEIKRY